MLKPEEARELIKEILSRDEFAGGWLTSLYTTVMSWLSYLLNHLNVAGLILVIISLAALFLITFLIIRYFTKNYKLPEKTDNFEQVERISNARQAFQQAEIAEKQGGYKEGIRLLLLSTILDMDSMGIIAYRPSRTNGEYLRELQVKNFSDYDIFHKLVFLFESIWYGRVGCGEEDYRQGLSLYERLQEVRR